MFAVNIRARPRAGNVVLRLDAVFQQRIQRPDQFLFYKHGDALDVHDHNVRNAGAGLHGQRELLVQIVRGHGRVVDLHRVLRGVERVDHGLHGRAVRAGEDGPVLDLQGSGLGYGHAAQRKQQGQDKRQGLFHGKTSFFISIRRPCGQIHGRAQAAASATHQIACKLEGKSKKPIPRSSLDGRRTRKQAHARNHRPRPGAGIYKKFVLNSGQSPDIFKHSG